MFFHCITDVIKSIIGFRNWAKNKKAAINLTNKSNKKSFQYATRAASNHKEIGKKSERITKVKSYIDK